MSARSSDRRGAWKGERSPAVASAHPSTGPAVSGRVTVPSSAPASTRATRRSPPASRSLRTRSPSATMAVAPEWASTWATSAGARRGFMGTATPPARWAAEYDTSQCRASSGCRWMPTRPPGSRPASRSRRARALAAPSHSANVMDPTSTTAKAVRSPNSMAMRARCSSISMDAGVPQGRCPAPQS